MKKFELEIIYEVIYCKEMGCKFLIEAEIYRPIHSAKCSFTYTFIVSNRLAIGTIFAISYKGEIINSCSKLLENKEEVK